MICLWNIFYFFNCLLFYIFYSIFLYFIFSYEKFSIFIFYYSINIYIFLFYIYIFSILHSYIYIFFYFTCVLCCALIRIVARLVKSSQYVSFLSYLLFYSVSFLSRL